MKKRYNRILALMLAATLSAMPVMETLAANSYAQGEMQESDVLFPGDTLFGEGQMAVEDKDPISFGDGRWVNDKDKAYAIATREIGTNENGETVYESYLRALGTVIKVVGGSVSAVNQPEENNHYHAQGEVTEEEARTDAAYYAEGTEVTVRAYDAPEGQVFDRWTVSGSDSFTLSDEQAQQSELTLTVQDKAVTLTATYKEAPAEAPAEEAAEEANAQQEALDAQTQDQQMAAEQQVQQAEEAPEEAPAEENAEQPEEAPAGEQNVVEVVPEITVTDEGAQDIQVQPAEENAVQPENPEQPDEETYAEWNAENAAADGTIGGADGLTQITVVDEGSVDILNADSQQQAEAQPETQAETQLAEEHQEYAIKAEAEYTDVLVMNADWVYTENALAGSEVHVELSPAEGYVLTDTSFKVVSDTDQTEVAFSQDSASAYTFTMPASEVTITAKAQQPEVESGEVQADVQNLEQPEPEQPETQAETQPETQAETQPETQAETQPETQPETQAETQPETQAETQPETQAETQPETQAPVAESEVTGEPETQIAVVEPKADDEDDDDEDDEDDEDVDDEDESETDDSDDVADEEEFAITTKGNAVITIQVDDEAATTAYEDADVTISAKANDGYTVTGWKVTTVSGKAVTVVEDDDDSSEASFIMPGEAVTVEALTKAKSKKNPAVKVENGSGTGRYEAGTKVTITADAPAAGYRFAYWQVKKGDVTLANPSAQTTTFTMPNSSVKVAAHYERISYNLTVKNGSGSGSYQAGTGVNLSANWPESGKEFDKWIVESGADPKLESGDRFYASITMPASDSTLTATYKNGPSANDNTITDLAEGGEYLKGAALTFTAVGAGMGNTNPNPGDYRFRPVSFTIGSTDGSLEEKTTRSMVINALGDYVLTVYFSKEVFDGSSWKADGSQTTVTRTIHIVNELSVKTGDTTPLIPIAITAGVALVILIILLILLRRRRR